MVRFIRTLALLALGVALLAPLAAAAAPLAAGQPSQTNLKLGAEDFLGWLHGALTAVWLEAGCRLDPNGLCLGAPPTATTPANKDRADPNGFCNR